MSKERVGVWLIGIAAITSIVIPVAIDFNDSHLFNPDWPGHARLHDAMSFLMSMGLGAGALWLIWSPERRRGGLLALAAILSVWGWVSLLLAGVFPGATYSNAAAAAGGPAPAIPPNAIVAAVITGLGLLGWWLVASGDPGRSTRGGTRTTA